jgi:trans-aconitate methyltransferase
MTDAWKHEDLPRKQLELNRKELAGSYPPHWRSLLACLRQISLDDLVFYDVGCGVGATYQLLRQEGISCRYFGFDFSDAMVETAKSAWNYDGFAVDDYTTTKREFRRGILYCNGLLDIMPDGVKELKTLLSLGAPYLILNRINIAYTKRVRVYKAYDTIDCYEYTFDANEFAQTIRRLGYDITYRDGTCFLLEKK